MDLAPEAVIDGKYRVVGVLGEGGSGVVYLVEHLFLRKQLALKVLRRELAENAREAARFEKEARAACQIDHQNIVRVWDCGRTVGGELYLVMELIGGPTLFDELTLQG